MLTMYGKSKEQILKLIQDDESKKNMTREEAMKKLSRCPHSNNDVNYLFLNRLEVLGLLKFDEQEGFRPHSIMNIEVKLNACGNLSASSCDDVVREIYRQGFKIVKT